MPNKKLTKNKNIKAIIFDIGGVLQLHRFTFGHRYAGFHDFMAERLRIGSDSWFDAIDKVYSKSMEGSMKGDEVKRQIAENVGVSLKGIVKISDRVLRKVFKKNYYLYKIARGLRKKGYIIGVLSDQWELSRRILAPEKDMKIFDVVVLSCEVGIRKPNPEIYHILMKGLRKKKRGLKFSEVVFIDNRDYNIIPAKKLGFKTIRFEDNKKLIGDLKKLGVKV